MWPMARTSPGSFLPMRGERTREIWDGRMRPISQAQMSIPQTTSPASQRIAAWRGENPSSATAVPLEKDLPTTYYLLLTAYY